MAIEDLIANNGRNVPNLTDSYMRGRQQRESLTNSQISRNRLAESDAIARRQQDIADQKNSMDMMTEADRQEAMKFYPILDQALQIENPSQRRQYLMQTLPRLDAEDEMAIQDILHSNDAVFDSNLKALHQQVGMLIGQQSGTPDPAEWRSFNLMTQGLSADDREKARRVALGLDSRAPSGGISIKEVVGSDGRKRLVKVDPAGNAVSVYDNGQWTEMGGQSAPSSNLTTSRPEEEQARLTAKETAIGKGEGEANVGAEDAIADIDKYSSEIVGFLNDPGFNMVYGLSGAIDPRMYIRGSKGSDAAARLEQLDAAAFGIAIQKMRGLGQLSNAEGLKVTRAFTRATNPRQSEESAKSAWNEVLDVLALARSRAARKAGVAEPPKPASNRIKVDAEGNVIGN